MKSDDKGVRGEDDVRFLLLDGYLPLNMGVLMVRGGTVSARGIGGGEVDSLLLLVRGGLPRLPRTRPRLVGRALVDV